MQSRSPDSNSTPLTLTTSEPLARALRRDHALLQKRAGRAAWEVPPIHGLQRWCRNQWLQTWPSAQLLHGVQELALWQRTIDEDDAAASVLSRAALAREARAMGRLVAQYRIDTSHAPRYTDEHQAFARWQRSVRRALAGQDWILECELPGYVAELVRAGEIPAPTSLILAGASQQLTPLERHLLQALEQAGCTIVQGTPATRQPALQARAYPDDEQQFRGLALALRDCLLAGDNQPEGPPDILVVCPDPQARRERIEAAFRPVLAPWLLLPGEGQRPLPWRFARGRGLDRQPLVVAALSICGLSEHGNTLDELSRLLLASVLWTPAQRELCAQAD
ncbi:MAG: hypothetical protein ACRES4_03730, partial [Nevskiales bacterium]